MRIDVISLFPAMFSALEQDGVVGRAIKSGLLNYQVWNPRDYTHDRHRTVDDRPYGGGPGMVMMVEPVLAAIHQARAACDKKRKLIYLSPQGKPLNQAMLAEAAQEPGLILLAGRYEGIDERVLENEVDEEWSLGDYVLSGGELAAMVVMDAITRLLPGALGHEDSAVQDSHANGMLDCPHYTRPEHFDGQSVPAVLLSGDHKAIARWRLQQSLGRTWLKRPDLLAKLTLNDEESALLEEFIRDYQAEKTV